MMLSDSFDENIPDIIWQGSEFEVEIKEKEVNCNIEYISTKEGGEFTIKIGWITKEGMKKMEEEEAKKAKSKKKAVASKKGKKTGVEFVEEEDIWAEHDEWDLDDVTDDDWEDSDFDDEW
jgi:hypothetical protein